SPCARSRSPAPSCSPRPAMPGGFSRHCALRTLTSAARRRWEIIFGRRVGTPPIGGYRTRLVRSGDEVTLNAFFRHSRVKSYLKCGKAFRIETVVNDTGD